MTADFLWQNIILGIVVFLYGIVIGSFLNVCILRIPLKESLSKKRSHCMRCGYQLAWYDLIPLFSYLFLGGKCRKCREHISVQYPIVEGLNGILYVLIFLLNGWSIDSVIYCLLVSLLIVFSMIDLRSQKIPLGIDLFILALGLVHLGFHLGDWVDYVIGLFAVSILLELIFRISAGKWPEYACVRLMRGTGLLLGWKLSIVSLVVGCILYGIIHFFSKRKNTFGACLSVGIAIAAACGQIINQYIGLLTAL